jgi:hypothetical protein
MLTKADTDPEKASTPMPASELYPWMAITVPPARSKIR